jgi:hypothetical protein
MLAKCKIWLGGTRYACDQGVRCDLNCRSRNWSDCNCSWSDCYKHAPVFCRRPGDLAVLCRDEQVMTINSANGGIRRVNAALEIVRQIPPPKFHRLAPLSIKAHLAANQGVLQQQELSRISGDSMSWEKEAPDSQAQITVHHFFVRLASPLRFLKFQNLLPAVRGVLFYFFVVNVFFMYIRPAFPFCIYSYMQDLYLLVHACFPFQV